MQCIHTYDPKTGYIKSIVHGDYAHDSPLLQKPNIIVTAAPIPAVVYITDYADNITVTNTLVDVEWFFQVDENGNVLFDAKGNWLITPQQPSIPKPTTNDYILASMVKAGTAVALDAQTIYNLNLALNSVGQPPLAGTQYKAPVPITAVTLQPTP